MRWTRTWARTFAGEILIEPGRYLVGDAGLIETEVVLISRRPADDQRRWVYLDIGMFNGLTETLEEAIRYRIGAPPGRTARWDRSSWPARRVTAPTSSTRGPATSFQSDLRIGDRLQLMSTGAYTSSYSSVWFNGFEPLRTFFVSADNETG